MARIQRKKTLQQKKKKRVGASTAENNTESLSGKSKPTLKAKAAKPDNFITKTQQFFKEVKIEFKKVAWPSRKQTIQSTIVVIILVIIISIFLGLVDFGLSSLIKLVLNQ